MLGYRVLRITEPGAPSAVFGLGLRCLGGLGLRMQGPGLGLRVWG